MMDHGQERDNLTRLLNLGRGRRVRVNRRYSVVVRSLRLVLPLAALAIVAIVMAWPKMDSTVAPVRKEDIIPQETGRNELINPRFESASKDMQPYIITATRAEQAMDNQKLVLLESPVANVTLAPGSILDAESINGIYDQGNETLILDGSVVLRHSNGYTLETPYLNVNLKGQTADTEQKVNVFGPDATLEGAGMVADGVRGTLVFTGPAKLIMNRGIAGF